MGYWLFEMQTLSKYLGSEIAPLYVRWAPEESPFTIELKLDVVARIRREIARNPGGGEIGGMLIGRIPNAAEPILRISEVQFLRPAPTAGKAFLLDPRERDRLIAARLRTHVEGEVLAGFFRTHERNGPMRPSLADRTLLAGEFDNSAYALLLIAPREPFTAAIFTGSKGELAQEPSVREFRFDHESLKALPEIDAPVAPYVEDDDVDRPRRRHSTGMAALALAASLVAAAFAWSGGRERAVIHADPSPGLQVQGNGVLQINWNQMAAPVLHAAAGRLNIADDEQRRELTITRDELRHGSVEYQPSGSAVRVQLTLDMPGGYSTSQAAIWRR